MPDVLTGEGTLLQIENATTTGTYDRIGQRVSIDGPEPSVEAVEKTHLDSTLKEYRASKIPEPGEVSLTVYLDPADAIHQRLEGMVFDPPAPGAEPNWRLVFNNNTNTRPHRQFAGFVTKFKYTGMQVEENLQAEMTIKVTGVITSGTTTLT